MEIDMPEDNNESAVSRDTKQSKRNSANIKKRLSQIEFEINEMNSLLSENIDITQKMMIEDSALNGDDEVHAKSNNKAKLVNDSKPAQETQVGEVEKVHVEAQKDKPITKRPVVLEATEIEMEDEDRGADDISLIEETKLLQEILDTPFSFVPSKEASSEKINTNTTSSPSSSYSSSSPTTTVKHKVNSIEAEHQKAKSIEEHTPTLQSLSDERIVDYKKNIKPNSNPQQGTRIVSNSIKSPFRVVSVSKGSGHSRSEINPDTTANSSVNKELNNDSNSETARDAFIKETQNTPASSSSISSEPISIADKRMTVSSLQLVYEHLDDKIAKIEREIAYLKKIMMKGGLNLSDCKKLQEGIPILENYLDKKIKLRYDIGVKLSRRLRQRIENGENDGIFFSGKI